MQKPAIGEHQSELRQGRSTGYLVTLVSQFWSVAIDNCKVVLFYVP